MSIDFNFAKVAISTDITKHIGEKIQFRFYSSAEEIFFKCRGNIF